jgi:hypothetical protein
MEVTGIWEGTLDGTHWGRLLAKLSECNGGINGFAEIIDVGTGTYNLNVTGDRRGNIAMLHLSPGLYGIHPYPGTIEVQLTSITDELVRGVWRSSIGTYGTLRAERQPSSEPTPEVVAKQIAESNAAFIIMSFADQNFGFIPIVDIHRAIKRGCEAVGVRAQRSDEVEHSGSITALLLDQIRRHRFLISDLTHERPNVYYEIGYAHGLEKEVVLTAQKGTQIHFDIASYNVIFYTSATDLEDRIVKRLQARINNA